MQAISFGYLTLPLEEVSTLAWEISVGDSPLSEEDTAAEDWTYYDDIMVKCTFELDLQSTLRRLRLPASAGLGAVIVARSTGTPLIMRSDVRSVRSGRQQIYLTVPGSQISGGLTLDFQMSLLEPGRTVESPFAPKKIGNTVFRVERKILLEGIAPRLPMLPVSFADHGIVGSESSLWWLRLSTHDLTASASSAIWLWLNVDNPFIVRMLEVPDSPESEMWLRFLEIDFMRQLLRQALSNDELSLQVPYPEESLGCVLSSLVTLLGNSLDQLRQRYEEDPGRLEAELQAKVGGVK
ncbi:hypothetical protein [Arthrobacter sp. Soil762]|uniref:hypothetical protein n=1 Tax=Arthrobacter sp. Soil762 TaxID=1736401 RepID=UPI0006FCDD00|nr:hypothetical protein [Arthrobacter sp. Soil762]KRE71697.1 hypothetical protein ASG77_11815 [Arthrobacter sp. Soil762]